MIHICFPLHDKNGTYSKIVGTAICSVLEHTQEKVTIHLLCNETLTARNKQNFIILTNNYGQKIEFHYIKVDNFISNQPILELITIGTLQRLYIPQIIYEKKIIYLDADIICTDDIKKLWDINISDVSIAACHDEGLWKNWRKYKYIDNEFFDKKKYFNGGVLIMNLEKIRKDYDLLAQATEFFCTHPECEYADQDAMNYIFSDSILILPQTFNLFVAGRRKQNDMTLQKAIYHYSGEDGKPKFLKCDVYDKLFLNYLQKTPWNTDDEKIKFYENKFKQAYNELNFLQSSLKNLFYKPKIFWGASGVLHAAILDYFQVNKNTDCYIDNNPNLWGKEQNGILIYAPQYLFTKKKGDFCIIVISKDFHIIKNQLLSMGYNENIDFFDGRRFLSEENGGYDRWLL